MRLLPIKLLGVVIGCIVANIAVGHDLRGLAGKVARPAQEVPDPAQPARAAPAAVSRAPVSASPVVTGKAIRNKNQAITIASDLGKRITQGEVQVASSRTLTHLQSVILRAKTWPPGSTLKVCFYEDGGTARDSIVSYAREWTQYGNIHFDFGMPPAYRTCVTTEKSDIRVTFRPFCSGTPEVCQGGYWSSIGTDAKFAMSEPSLGLENFDQADPQTVFFKATVLHEFGHALGLHHEHQTPAADCEQQIETEKVKQIYGWTDADIETNFKKIMVSSRTGVKNGFGSGTSPQLGPVTFSVYDPKSIMHYSLRRDIFKEPPGSCFIPQNEGLSDGDKAGISKAYPNVPAAVVTRDHNNQVNILLQNRTLSDIEKSALRSLKIPVAK